MDEILRLVVALAQQMLASEMTEPSITPERLKVLMSAAQFLHDNDVPWPPVVREAMGKIAERMEAAHGDREP
ncbi:hypothetical protein ACRAWG_36365 [Methylobacterium sp. P31]